MWFRTGISETVWDTRCVFCHSGQDLKKVRDYDHSMELELGLSIVLPKDIAILNSVIYFFFFFLPLLLRVPLYLWGPSYWLLSLKTNIHSWDYIPIFLISWNLKIWQVSIWGNASKGNLWCVWMLSYFLKECFLLMFACFLLDFLLSTGWVLWFFFLHWVFSVSSIKIFSWF